MVAVGCYNLTLSGEIMWGRKGGGRRYYDSTRGGKKGPAHSPHLQKQNHVRGIQVLLFISERRMKN